MTVSFCIPTSNEWRFLLFTSLSTFGVVSVSDFCHFHRYGVVSCCFNLKFLSDIWCWTKFNMLIWHLYIFGEVSAQIFAHFLIKLSIFLWRCPFSYEVVHFIIVQYWVLCILCIIVLYQIGLLQIVSSSLRLVFSFFSVYVYILFSLLFYTWCLISLSIIMFIYLMLPIMIV